MFFFTYSLITLILSFFILVIDTYFIHYRIITIPFLMLFVVFLVSGYVIIYSLDYISLYDYPVFFLYIVLFELSMLGFVLGNDFVISFLNWELVGVISYLLVNFWSNKNQCGIKAIVYNNLGDCFFLLAIFVGLSYFLSYDYELSIFFLFHFVNSYCFAFSTLLISFFTALSTNSAQFPFSSWLIYAMSAPTPISSLLHSSTMVIAGIYLGFIISVNFIFMFSCSFLLILYISSISILWSSFLAFFITDMNSIIAYSTISQIGYMLLASLVVPSFSMYHIVVHAFFNSLLFLLSAEIIHNSQANWQSIYTLNINTTLQNSFLRIYFIILSLALMFSASNEGILNHLYYLYSKFIFLIAIISALFTTFYTLLFLFFASSINCFNPSLVHSFNDWRNSNLAYSSFVTLAITALIVDNLFSDILSFMFIACSSNYFGIFHLSFLAFFLLFFSIFYKFFTSIKVSLPYSSFAPFLNFFNFLPYLNSISWSFSLILETFSHLGLTFSIHTSFILSCFSLNTILLSFLSISGFLPSLPSLLSDCGLKGNDIV